MKEKEKTIASILKEYLDNHGELCGPMGKFSGRDFNAITKVLNGTADNFVMFDNAGGKKFEIWFFDDMKKKNSKVSDFEKWIKEIGHTFMYKINGKETIVKTL